MSARTGEEGSSWMWTKADKGERGFSESRRPVCITCRDLVLGVSIGSSQQPAHIINRTSQTEATNHQLYHGLSRRFWAFIAETVDEWDEISLPCRDTALASNSLMDDAWFVHRHDSNKQAQQPVDCMHLASKSKCGRPRAAVSYTHLTLPTNREV